MMMVVMVVEPVQLLFLLIASSLIRWILGDLAADSNYDVAEPIDLPTRQHVVPKCVYAVHALDVTNDAEVLTHVSIGDWLQHSWRCSRDETSLSSSSLSRRQQRTRWRPRSGSRESYAVNDEIYCMMVHNCTISNQAPTSPQQQQQRRRQSSVEEATTRRWRRVANGADSSGAVELIDEFGCSLHPTVLPNVRYGDDGLSAELRAQAFSLDIDKPAIYFKCNIRLLLKRGDVCRRPVCAAESAGADDRR